MAHLGETEILRAVGASLSNWSMVEMQLSTLFRFLSEMPDGKAHAAFDGIISFQIRLGLCDRLMALESLDSLEVEMWRRLSARLTKFYKKRHELAHFSLLHDDNGGVVIHPFLTFEKMLAKNRKGLSLAQIRERSEKFIELHMAIFWFSQRAWNRRSGKSQSQAPDPEEPVLVPRLRDQAIQNLEVKKPQQ